MPKAFSVASMGMDITYSKKDISAEGEIERLEKRLTHRSVEMTIQNKSNFLVEPISMFEVGSKKPQILRKMPG